VLLAAFMLASIGGRYSWPVVPALIAATGLFLLSGARIAADQSTRALDITVMILLALIGTGAVLGLRWRRARMAAGAAAPRAGAGARRRR